MMPAGPSWPVRLSALAGLPVIGPDDTVLGEIEDFFLDARRGAIDSATLRLKADEPTPSLRVTVPWSQLRLHESGQHLELDIGLDTLVTVASRRAGPDRR